MSKTQEEALIAVRKNSFCLFCVEQAVEEKMLKSLTNEEIKRFCWKIQQVGNKKRFERG